MMKAQTVESVNKNLLSEAAEWRLISLLFECPINNWRDQVIALAAEIDDETLKAAAASIHDEVTEGLYHSTFGPGGPAPPREVSYRDWIQPGYLISELTTYYDAFSYKPVTREVLDHVSVETGFIAYLKLKEAYATACGDDDHAAVTADAAKDFINEHLQHIAEPLAGLLEHSGLDYLALASAALLRRVGPRKDKSKGTDLPVLPVLSDIDEPIFDCS